MKWIWIIITNKTNRHTITQVLNRKSFHPSEKRWSTSCDPRWGQIYSDFGYRLTAPSRLLSPKKDPLLWNMQRLPKGSNDIKISPLKAIRCFTRTIFYSLNDTGVNSLKTNVDKIVISNALFWALSWSVIPEKNINEAPSEKRVVRGQKRLSREGEVIISRNILDRIILQNIGQ